MNSQTANLEELVRAVQTASQRLADVWETTAIIESLGYTDRVIAEEFGFANALALGQYVYERLSSEPSEILPPPRAQRGQELIKEMRDFIEQFSRSFIYALPWIAKFLLEYAQPRADTSLLPPELAAPLSLAVMASLITSGGFLQVIARRGHFYINLGEPALARRVCAQFMRAGLAATILLGFAGLLFGLYRALFTDKYMILAAVFYLLLSLLWMICAALSIQKYSWRIPIIFIAGGLLFAILRAFVGMGALTAQLMALIATVAIAAICARVGFASSKDIEKMGAQEMELPRIPALLSSLAPYFCYGAAYFSFLFADRIAAGSAAPAATGLSFAVDPQYKLGMDIALLNFLLIAALIEYLNYNFMRYWRARAAQVKSETLALFARQLRNRYWLLIALIALAFSLSGIALLMLLSRLSATILPAIAMRAILIGGGGYLLFSIGLFNAISLFSLARPIAALRALLPALAVNLVIGYCLSHLIGAHYAAIGLLLGAALFVALSTSAMMRALAQPDYAYFAA
jgi:hypothetical protein